MQKYTLKRKTSSPASSAETPPPISKTPTRNRGKIIIYILAVLCVGLSVTNVYYYNQTQALKSDKAELRVKLKQCGAELSDSKAALAESQKEASAYKQLKNYYMPYERLYNDLYDQVYPEKSDSIIIDPYNGDLGLYQKYDENGDVVSSDEVVKLVEENRKKGINPVN